jgi:hypothetical protein
MNSIKIPGFTADVSIYNSDQWYFGGAATPEAHMPVTPAIIIPIGPFPVFRLDCPLGYTNCGGTCRNLNFDKSNCGACGHVCGGEVVKPPGTKYPSPFFCFNGVCACQYGPHTCCEEDGAGNCTKCAIPPAVCT